MKKIFPILLISLFFVSCGFKEPVVYPNQSFKNMGKIEADKVLAECEMSAKNAGIEKDKSAEKALRRGAGGAVGGAAASAAATAIYGGNVGRATAAGAAGGGLWLFFNRMFESEAPNPTYQNFVSRCAREKGLDIIGWE